MDTVREIFRFLANFMQALVMVLPDIIDLIHSRRDYWRAKNQRIKDAIADEVAAKLRAQDTASRKAQANLKAALFIYGQVWKDTYMQFLEHLNSNHPENALLMFKEQYFTAASEIIFDNQQSNDIKAQLLTDIIRNASE